MHLITLTTDFGASDWFVGTMKGVILGINPRARIVDLTHGIPSGDIPAGAFALAASCRFLPKGTVHVVVVDPGVGSTRQALAVQTTNGFFVGPDNGVLSWALAREKIRSVHALENDAYFLRPVSRTFHGRDVFAPVAAHLSCGVPLRRLGPPLKEMVRLVWPEPRRQEQILTGQVVYLDRFGNAITNIEGASLPDLGADSLDVFVRRKRLCAVAAYYESVVPGQPVAVVGSTGLLEIAVNQGSAERRCHLKVGEPVTIRPIRTRKRAPRL